MTKNGKFEIASFPLRGFDIPVFHLASKCKLEIRQSVVPDAESLLRPAQVDFEFVQIDALSTYAVRFIMLAARPSSLNAPSAERIRKFLS